MRLIRAFVMVIACSAHASAGGGGSPYTIFGIGDIRFAPNTQSIGMGYTGIAIAQDDFVHSLSPASWAKVAQTSVDAAFTVEGFSSSDANGSIKRARGDFNGAVLALPLAPSKGIVFVGGIVPYSGVEYNFFRSGSQQGVDYAVNYVGSGGLAKAMGGLSYSPLPTLSIGASFNYLFGTIERNQRFLSLPSKSVTGVYTEKTTDRGVFGTVGARFTGFGGISEPLGRLSLGVVVSSRTALTVERQTTYVFQYIGENDTSEISKPRTSIPLAVGVGLAFQPSPRFMLAADYIAQGWESAEFDGASVPEIRNSTRIGIGGERMPNRSQMAPWLDRIAYRLGFFHHATYYRINGEPVNEWVVTGGLGIPFSGNALLNIAVEYGSRGTTDKNLVRDKIFRLTAALHISELWFVKFEEE